VHEVNNIINKISRITILQSRNGSASTTTTSFFFLSDYRFINCSYDRLGFQQGDAWVLEKVFVDILSPDADQKLRKEEEEIEAGSFKRDRSEDKSEEDPRTYFTSETVTLYDSKPENKVVDLDADQVEVIEKETRQKIEQFKKDGEYKF
jgi:hypothetical protein